MKKTLVSRPYAIKALRAIEAFVGNRELLAQELGVSINCIARWVMKKQITSKHVLKLSKLMDNKFSVEELLGSRE